MTGREVLRKLLDNSAGCVCIEYKEGECPCEKEINQALTALREVVLGKKKEAKYIDSPEAIRFNNEQYLKTEGYNQALENIANLFRDD